MNPTLREALWSSCRDVSMDRKAIIANGDTVKENSEEKQIHLLNIVVFTPERDIKIVAHQYKEGLF